MNAGSKAHGVFQRQDHVEQSFQFLGDTGSIDFQKEWLIEVQPDERIERKWCRSAERWPVVR
jgi:hypothetical protein